MKEGMEWNGSMEWNGLNGARRGGDKWNGMDYLEGMAGRIEEAYHPSVSWCASETRSTPEKRVLANSDNEAARRIEVGQAELR